MGVEPAVMTRDVAADLEAGAIEATVVELAVFDDRFGENGIDDSHRHLSLPRSTRTEGLIIKKEKKIKVSFILISSIIETTVHCDLLLSGTSSK